MVLALMVTYHSSTQPGPNGRGPNGYPQQYSAVGPKWLGPKWFPTAVVHSWALMVRAQMVTYCSTLELGPNGQGPNGCLLQKYTAGPKWSGP